jgi:hypothetical protein
MAENPTKSPLNGLSAEVQRTMARLLRMPPEPQKEAQKLTCLLSLLVLRSGLVQAAGGEGRTWDRRHGS